MRVIIFGATGMVGGGVLRECLRDPAVTAVLSVGRRALGVEHPKLRELVRSDLADLAPVAAELAGYDACFYCLGVSSVGMSEADYRHVTYDLTMAAAEPIAASDPGLTFVYVSGAGTDTSERGRVRWARIKGATENALLALPFQAYMFRPGYIHPMHGVSSRTGLYRTMYVVAAPLYPVLRRLFPRAVTTTEQLGRAMIGVAQHGAASRVLETPEINAVRTDPTPV